MNVNEMTTVGELGEGDFLVDLDNGYVVDVEEWEESVRITFHDADGNECYLETGSHHPIRVKRDI